MKYLTVLLAALIFFNAGCSLQNSPAQKPQFQPPQTQQPQTTQPQTTQHTPADQDTSANAGLAAKAKAAAKKTTAVEDVVAVALGKDISVAVKVTGLNRLRLQSIRQEVHERIARLAPGYRVFVTTDKKLYWELEQLNSQMQQSADAAKLKAELAKINKKMRG